MSSGRVDLLGVEQSRDFAQLNGKVQELTREIQRQQTTGSRSFQRVTQSLDSIGSRTDRIQQTLDRGKVEVTGLRNDLDHRFNALQSRDIRKQLLDSLFYPDHDLRREMVKPPYLHTFDWMFDEKAFTAQSGRLSEPLSNFPKFLKGTSPLYWISGKAASRKSTLMAHITNKESTKALLEIWAAGNPLNVLSFFFWRPGSTLQKNVVGLLRSLLLQLLTQVPDLPQELIVGFSLSHTAVPAWSEKRLREAFEKALRSTLASHHRFCVFIDGLDEFEGDVDELISLVVSLGQHSHVKCCVSSRPEVQLVHHLSSCERLRLEDLNYKDIVEFVEGKLEPFEQRSKIKRWICEEIGSRAKGVFLWAALLTKSVVEGLHADDDDHILRARHYTFPAHMDAVYEKMMADIDEVHKESLSFCTRSLILCSKTGEDENVIDGFPVGCNIALLTAASGLDPLRYAEFLKHCQRIEKQVVAQSKGLLEIVRPTSGFEHPCPHVLIVPQDRSNDDERLSVETSVSKRLRVSNLRAQILSLIDTMNMKRQRCNGCTAQLTITLSPERHRRSAIYWVQNQISE